VLLDIFDKRFKLTLASHRDVELLLKGLYLPFEIISIPLFLSDIFLQVHDGSFVLLDVVLLLHEFSLHLDSCIVFNLLLVFAFFYMLSEPFVFLINLFVFAI
jgi:hypothetical protein